MKCSILGRFKWSPLPCDAALSHWNVFLKIWRFSFRNHRLEDLNTSISTSALSCKSCWIPSEGNYFKILHVKLHLKKKKSCVFFASPTAFDFLPATRSLHKNAAVDKPDTPMTYFCKLEVKSLTLKLTPLSSNTESTALLCRFSS